MTTMHDDEVHPFAPVIGWWGGAGDGWAYPMYDPEFLPTNTPAPACDCADPDHFVAGTYHRGEWVFYWFCGTCQSEV